MGELVVFPVQGGLPTKGLVLNLEKDYTRVALFAQERDVPQNTKVYRSGNLLNIPVGPGLLGRVVDALGQPIDGRFRKGDYFRQKATSMQVKAPGII